MFFVFIFWAALEIFAPIDGQTCNSPDNCRQLEFLPEYSFDGKRLIDHVINTVDVIAEGSCRTLCYLEADCVSYNFKKAASENGKYTCELNNSTFEGQEKEMEEKSDYIYQGAKNACVKKPCQNKATCQTGFTDKGYRCLCTAGFNGERCEKGCGDGAWTLVMKMDGNKQTFHYHSPLWSNKESFNLDGGKTGFDTQETKLPTYWNTSFSKICLGMKIGQEFNFIGINKQAKSLHSLIADGQYHPTSLGRDTWKLLIGSKASLQKNCNKEGFNAVGYYHSEDSKARIGILGNQQDHCNSCDSRIGFGTGGKHDKKNTCGNEATREADNGDKHIKAMGYILVQ